MNKTIQFLKELQNEHELKTQDREVFKLHYDFGL